MNRNPLLIAAAFLFSMLVLGLGHAAFGFWTMLIFTSGFVGGFVLWLIFPANPSFAAIKVPYFLALGLFVIHRIEEYAMDFFDTLAAITGTGTPDTVSWQVILLVLLSVGAWLLVPPLVSRGYPFGTYLAWTFFAAMGITELAHFVVFPWFTPQPFSYFPGMASVVLLAPVAWWGMWRLSRGT